MSWRLWLAFCWAAAGRGVAWNVMRWLARGAPGMNPVVALLALAFLLGTGWAYITIFKALQDAGAYRRESRAQYRCYIEDCNFATDHASDVLHHLRTVHSTMKDRG